MARVGTENYEMLLKKEHAQKMNFTGKPMKGMLYVDPKGLTSDDDLKMWIDACFNFISTLPQKK